MAFVLVACATNTSNNEDASTDAPGVDAPHDATTDPSQDGQGVDASSDGATDAPNDTSLDAIDDSSQDAAMDAPVADASDGGGTIDASVDGGKKSCLGVFCIKGYACCNNMASKNYGTCQSLACSSCCI